jgi:hypothetical protein
MGRSRHLNVDCARGQEAYFARIRAAANALSAGSNESPCPRDGCDQSLLASRHGSTLILRCPACGIIYRGNRDRLMEYFDG